MKAETKLCDVTATLNIQSFTYCDIEFLKEYEHCMRPIAYSLDKSQGDNMFLGDIYPWILAIENKLNNMHRDTNNLLKYCEPLKQQLLSSLKTRFSDLFNYSDNAKDYIIATVSHPSWIPKDIMLEVRRNNIKEIVLQALKEIVNPEALSVSQSSSSLSQDRVLDVDNENFFSFMEESIDETEDNSNNILEVELLQYLNDKDSRILILQNT